MKKLSFCAFFLVLSWQLAPAQEFPGLDESPMDMAYYPPGFAHDRIFDPDQLVEQEAMVRVIYSRPQKKGREIFGDLIPYGEVWRTGANETTEIKFYKDVTVGGQRINSGIYSLFTIPGENNWTIILNAGQDYWGAYEYNPDHDVTRIDVPVKETEKTVEAFAIQFKKVGEGEAIMKLAWDRTMVEMPFYY